MDNLQLAHWTLLLHIAATFSMVGLIWFVQVVHYPLMSRVPSEKFPVYELDHQRLTTLVVAPLMSLELLSAIGLLWCRPAPIGDWLVWIGLLLLLSIWLATYAVQVPQHASLGVAFDSRLHRRLVQGNWYRTIAWSIRGLLVLWMVGALIQAQRA